MGYTNLDYLKSFTGDDPELIKESIKRYLKKSPVLLAELNDAYKNEDWEKVAFTAHNLYSATQIVGMEIIKIDLRDMQHITKEERNPQKNAEFRKSLEEVNKAVEGSIRELNDYI